MQDSRDIENYINNELSAIGFPALDFNNTRETLGSIFSLLKQRQVIELNQRDIAYRQELQQRIQMVDQEHVQLETKLSKIKKQMEIKTKELGELQSKFTTSESQAKIKQRLANEKLEELRKAKSSLSHLRNQFENETRKFNKEKERLNSKVARLVSDPTKQALTFAMTGPLETVEPSNQTDGETYQIIVNSYEEREREILEENTYLRQLVQDIFHTVVEKRNYLETELAQGNEEINRGLEEFVDLGIFQLPVEMMRDTIIESFDTMFCDVGEMFGQCASNDHQEIEILKIENMEKNVELAKKQELIDKLQKTAQHAPAVRFCYVTSEVAKADIEREWDEIKKQKDLLDQERKNFTDAAIKLGLERGALQNEKKKFEEEKATFSSRPKAEQLPNVSKTEQLPSTPAWLKGAHKLPFQADKPKPLRLSHSLKNEDLKELNAESQKHNQENVEWLQSEAPALVDLKDEESPVKKEMESEILVESKTLNLSTPKATKSSIKTSHDNSSAKSVRIALPEEVNQSTPTGVTYNLRKMQLKSPFNHRRMPLRNPVATSTPKI